MSELSADAALLERWSTRRDVKAFTELVSRHSAMVYTTCKRVLQNEADAEDVSQECFIELAQTDQKRIISLSGWLHRLATSRSLDRMKTEKRRKAREKRSVADTSRALRSEWEELLESAPPRPFGGLKE